MRSTSSSTGSSRTTPSCASSSRDEGHVFSSETDAEIVAHLIEKHYDGDLTEAVRDRVRRASRSLRVRRDARRPPRHARRGAPGVPARDRRSATARRSSPRRSPRSSPRPARCCSSATARSITVTPDGRELRRRRRQPWSSASPSDVDWDQDAAEKGGYATFMLKEIHEQADAVAETITDRLPDRDRVDLSELDLARRLPDADRPDRDRRLRHQLPRRPRRPLRDRAVGPGAGRDGRSPPSTATATRS